MENTANTFKAWQEAINCKPCTCEECVQAREIEEAAWAVYQAESDPIIGKDCECGAPMEEGHVCAQGWPPNAQEQMMLQQAMARPEEF